MPPPPLYLHFTCSLWPLFCPFASLSRPVPVSSVPSFFPAQRLSGASVSCRLKSSFSLCVLSPSVLVPSCGKSRWIFLLVHIIAPAWYEIVHWLHRFKPQSVALFSWFCMINKQTRTTAKCWQIRGSGGKSPCVCRRCTDMYNVKKFQFVMWISKTDCNKLFRTELNWSDYQNVLQVKCHPVTERSALTFSHDPLLRSCFI